MSGATIGGAVGAFVGSFFGPMGTQIGWMLGSAIGGYVDPEVIKNQGPRLNDAMQQTSRDGVPIPFGYGTFPTAGNIIWRAPLVENVITTRERQGKGGGPVVENTTYQYTRSYAIGVCAGPVEGILIVKENGAIVYDARTDAELTAIGYDSAQISQTRAASAAWLAGVRIYLGDETQVADSVIEAHEGVGNVHPYRGLCYIVRENHDLTDFRGAIPQYEFVVVAEGTAESGFGTPQWVATNGDDIGFSDDGVNWEAPEVISVSEHRLTYGGGVLLKWDGSDFYRSTDRGANFAATTTPISMGSPNTGSVKYFAGQWWAVDSNQIHVSPDGDTWDTHAAVTTGSGTCVGGRAGLAVIGDNFGQVRISTDNGLTWSGGISLGIGSVDLQDIASDGSIICAVGEANVIATTTNGTSWTLRTSAFPGSPTIKRIRHSEGLGLWVATGDDNAGAQFSADTVTWTASTTTFPFELTGLDCNDEMFVAVGGSGASSIIYTSTDGDVWTAASETFDSVLTDVAAMPCDGTPIPGSPGFYVHDDGTICGPAGGTLDRDRIVLGTIVADICQRHGLDADQYDVSDLTDILDGYRIATEGGGDSFIGPLMAGYFFDVAEWDGKVRFIKRGGSSLLTLTMDDLAERDGDAIQQERVQEAELLRKNTITYIDPVATYTPTTQQWERRAGTVQAKGEASIELPVVTDATSMAQTAEKRGKVAWSETEKYEFNLPAKFSRITPTDVITLIDADDVSHRIRVMKAEEDSGVLQMEAVRDRQPAYIGTVTGASPSTPPGQTPPTVRGPTIGMAFNGPPPTITEESKAGIWVGGMGLLPGWVGYDLYISVDGGDTETHIGRYLSPARIGWLRSAITSSSATIPVTMYGDAEIETVTDAGIDALQNIWAIKTGNNTEFGQSQTSTAVADGFDLTENDRGLLGEATSHFAEDEFCMVDEAMNYIPVDIRHTGVELVIRLVSIGTVHEDNPTISLVYDPPEIVWDGNGDDDEDEEGPDPGNGGAGAPGSPTLRTIGATVVTPSLTAGEGGASANSTAINAAFAGLPVGGGTVRIPAGTWYINTANPIEPVNNSRLDLDTNDATLRAAYSSTTTAPSVHRDIIRIDGVHDVEIVGGRLIGYRDAWAANGGVSAFGVSEWGHGIYTTGSSYNITIYNLSGEKFIGDGISIGRSTHDIHVLNCLFTNNRRQGISTGGDDILIENCECSYIGTGDGTAPKAGIDIEIDGPETNTSNNTTIRNCYLHHNAGPGLICYRSCDDITIEDLRSEYNTKGIYAYDSQNVTISGTSLLRWNKYEGIHLASTCANWDIGGVTFYSNKTTQYGTFATGLDTTSSPTTTQKAKHITVASTVTGTTYGTNTYGPV